jgi:hypothetical protein
VDVKHGKACQVIEHFILYSKSARKFKHKPNTMQNNGNRDLMVVLKDANIAPDVLNAETEWLNSILNTVESTRNLAYSCEILNLTRYKVERKYDKVLKALSEKPPRPFVFIFNKN